ncbi:thioredoxin-related transmembrane protein 2 homolog [Adelges cooleyi]|uniref:thioredoxin-related transmembrane protein 2 homolog n=1 Tax=Adelges cooleyi TaxID=133065 RepID=UPI00217FF09D|nr:thioredoxin-related transmembrane protein 2 homolog [Adelges cooleyi]XP_050434992.1 thioredoxin-related transmembrane protein 2 homolog [Adelges cooleyi]
MIVPKKDLLVLLKPYYWVNVMLTCSFVFCKKNDYVCRHLFEPTDTSCELDTKELEILLFVMIVIMIRTRKAGSVTMVDYLSSSFIYTKTANLLLWFFADARYGLIYSALVIIITFVLPAPTYSGPENVVYFRSLASLEETLRDDKYTVWIVCFYTTWNPSCANFAPIFSQLSVEYDTKYLKFGKIDVSRYPDAAQKFNINDTSFSRQLPTVVLFKNGLESVRRPVFDAKGKVYKFFFTESNFKAVFDMNNVYADCKKTLDKKKNEGAEKTKSDKKKKTS